MIYREYRVVGIRVRDLLSLSWAAKAY